MFLAAQLSLYPLGRSHLSQVIEDAVKILKEHGLEVTTGAMSSLATGDDEALFEAVKDIFLQPIANELLLPKSKY